MFEIIPLHGWISLGKQGENLARKVYFDEIRAWKETFGEGKCELLHQRNGDEAPYPVVLDLEDDRVCWKITNSDTAIVGDGKCELHYTVDGVVVKSKTWKTSVAESLGGDIAEPPEPYQGWVDEVLDAAEKIETEMADLVEETRELNEKTSGVVDAEAERVEVENIRQTNEQNRINAEIQRETLTEELETLKEETEILKQDLAQTEGQFAERSQQALDDFQIDASTKLQGFDDDRNRLISEFEQDSQQALEEVQEATDRANKAVDDMPNTFANVLKGTASGEVVSISDVAPVEHNMAVTLSSKNIYDPKGRITPKTDKGLTIQYLEDEDCYLLNGTPTTTGAYYMINETILVDDYISFACEVVSGSVDNPDNKYMMFYVGYKDSEDDSRNNWASVNLKDGVNVAKTAQKYIGASWFYIADGITFNNYKVRVSVEKGTVATNYTPYIADISTVKLDALGKNLIPYPYAETTKELNGITFTDNGDGSITVKGTATGSSYFRLMNNADFGLSFGSGSNWSAKGGTNGIYTTNKGLFYNANNKSLTINVANGATVNETLYPQLEVGTTQTSYEPYIEPTTYTPNADGTVANVKSIYPTTTLVPSEQGVLVECEYNRDLNKAFEEITNAIIALGGNV